VILFLKYLCWPHSPLLQSPVKMRVEAFENAAIAQTNMRPKRGKDMVSHL